MQSETQARLARNLREKYTHVQPACVYEDCESVCVCVRGIARGVVVGVDEYKCGVVVCVWDRVCV